MFWLKVCLVGIFFIQSVSAYASVSPAKYDVVFKPNLEQTFKFNFLTEDPNSRIEILIGNDFKEYIQVDKTELTGGGEILVTLKFPERVDSPGPHRISIIANRLPLGESSAGIAVVESVSGAIDLFVPYPGKYVETAFNVENVNVGETINFDLKIKVKGNESVTANSRIDIYNSENKKIDTIPLLSRSMNPEEEVLISVQKDSRDYGAGNYRAVAVVEYGGEKEAISEDLFRLGELRIGIINYTRIIEKKEIVPIDVEIESYWNDPIENVYVSGRAIDYSVEFVTPSVNLAPWEVRRVTGFIDTSKIDSPNFKVLILVNYAGKTTQKEVTIYFKQETSYLLIVGVVVLALLYFGILVLIYWLIHKSRRKPENEQTSKTKTASKK